MNKRYECIEAGTCPVAVLTGAAAAEERVLTGREAAAGRAALVLGDAYPLAVTGTPDELRAFLAKAAAELATATGEPEERCGLDQKTRELLRGPARCGERVWPYTEHNVCVLDPGHGGDHEDDEGRPFDHGGYRRTPDGAPPRRNRDVSGADDGLGRVHSDTEWDAPGF